MLSSKRHSGASKRFKVTGSGAIKYKHTKKRHLLRKRTTKQKRHLSVDGILGTCDAPAVRLLLKVRRRVMPNPAPVSN